MTATGPLLAAQVPRISVDPYADAVTASPVRFLYRLNPLAKLLAPVPAMIMLIFVRDAATPLAFVLLSKLYRQMYANTGIATDSARVNRANRWARLIARPCRRLFVARPLPPPGEVRA